MTQINEESSTVQVKELKNGTTECFSFEFPKGQLSKKSVEAYINLLQENEISELMDSLLHLYFTARDDEYFEMDEIQRTSFENILKFLTKNTCERVAKL